MHSGLASRCNASCSHLYTEGGSWHSSCAPGGTLMGANGSAGRPLESVQFPSASCTDIEFLERQLHGLAAELLARL